MSKINVIDQDIIFLSYDEPNAEKHYSDLLTKVPWAKRVHGVKGSDAAHKACAEISETEYFVTVDADNIVNPAFFRVEIDLDELGLTNDHVFSWCGKVSVNNLMYGNGGLKMWTREFVKNMKTHENADPTDLNSAVDFCFDGRYYQFEENYSTSHINGSSFQAWRAGFREGVKMSLDQGEKAEDLKSVWWQNYQRLLIWMSVGADAKHGLWSILGARQGCYMVTCTDWNHADVKDFEWLTNFWDMTVKEEITSEEDALNECIRLGRELKLATNIEIDKNPLSHDQSIFFKQVYNNSPRFTRKVR